MPDRPIILERPPPPDHLDNLPLTFCLDDPDQVIQENPVCFMAVFFCLPHQVHEIMYVAGFTDIQKPHAVRDRPPEPLGTASITQFRLGGRGQGQVSRRGEQLHYSPPTTTSTGETISGVRSCGRMLPARWRQNHNGHWIAKNVIIRDIDLIMLNPHVTIPVRFCRRA